MSNFHLHHMQIRTYADITALKQNFVKAFQNTYIMIFNQIAFH